MPGRKYSAGSGYRYGFNGKELDKETTSTTTYDYGFRIYNPALGRFLSVDPLFKSFPWNSPYSYAEGDPINSIDLDGLEKIRIVQRTFAPWALFGDILPKQKPYAGDNRGFSMYWRENGKDVTSRIVSSTVIDVPNSKQVGNTNVYCHPSIGPKNFYGAHGSSTEIPDEVTRTWQNAGWDATTKTYVNYGVNAMINFSGHDARINDLMAPDIEWTGRYYFDDRTPNILGVKSNLEGKGFPAYETFIEDEAGKRIMLFTFSAPEKSSIGRLLIPTHKDYGGVEMKIHLDANKNFTGNISVKELNTGKRSFWEKLTGQNKYVWNDYKIDDWNKKQTSKKAAPDK